MKRCPQCGRLSLEYSRGTGRAWCRHVVDCAFSAAIDEIEEADSEDGTRAQSDEVSVAAERAMNLSPHSGVAYIAD